MGEQEQDRGTRHSVVFAVNGEKFEVSSVDPSTTLLEFLRYHTRFKSVKLGCGGCGACVVLLSKYNPELHQVEDFAVSSCLTLLCSVNGCSITTSEGLGNSKTGFHPIHQRFVGFHASQCGFCTPGMCMSLFSALVDAEKTHRPEPPPGLSKLTISEAEKAIAGNLCRCTGYRPIADACKSFAADVDIEDLGFNSFWGKGESKEVKISRLPPYKCNGEFCTFPQFLKKESSSAMLLDVKGSWHSPVSVQELQNLFESNVGSNQITSKLVAGNTGMGYYKEVEHYDQYIDIRYIPELSVIRRDQTGIEIGATVTISKAIEVLKEETKEFHPEAVMVFKKIAGHMEKIASRFIRNSASVGGNLVMAQGKHFPSDVATVLLGVGAMVNIMTGQKCEKLMLEEFLERPPLDSRSLLLSLEIPCWDPNRNVTSKTNSVLLFETYRAAPRPLGNALPHLNAAFLAEVSPCKTGDGIRVNNCQLAFGAFGTKHAIRARRVEEFLMGKVLRFDVLYEAIKLLRDSVVPEDGTSVPAYRSSLAVGFLFEFFGSLAEMKNGISRDRLCGYSNSVLLKDSLMQQNHEQFDKSKVLTLLSSAEQVVQLSREYFPVGEPIPKSGAALQASGEAIFVDDIPSPINCLYGAFVYSTKPLAWIRSVEIKSKSLLGVSAFLSYKDIPEAGQNIGSRTKFGPEPLFADELTHCAGQPIAFVVADTQKIANRAADLAVVDYDVGNLEPPILSVEEAVGRSSFFEVKLGSQYYFYMETQTALAVPDEDNCLVVYSSIQCPEYAHATIARCLGIPEHNVRVITRRVGGGFGGKAIKAMPVATACALAAYKLCRPVRIYVNRKTDMVMAGGRHPMKIEYNVGFKSNGKITALQLNILIDAGQYPDVSPNIPAYMIGALKKYDWGALHFDIKVCRTNLPSRTAMRAPGEVQGSFIAEAVIEHVASTLSMEVDFVRSINLHTHNSLNLFYESSAGELEEYTIPLIWDRLAVSSSFNQRTEVIKEFNRSNLWRKKGISRVPIVYDVPLMSTPGKVSILSDGSVVVEVGGIELGQGLWTKVKQMAAFALSSIQCGGMGDLLEKVRVIQADTLSVIQGGLTAGSTKSEASCQAVRNCCKILVERLTPLRERLQAQMGSVKWETLIQQAYLQSVSLSASSLYLPDFTSMKYLNYGAAVSEVEINLLTGETTIVQSDIIYDCGQSLNPAVDLGQGIGFFMLEEYPTNSDGLVVSEGTWTYKIPTLDTIPKQFNVEILNSGHHKKRVLSSKASGEPPLLLAVSVHCATRAAIREARKQLLSWSQLDQSDLTFDLEVPATVQVVKELCGPDSVEKYLQWRMAESKRACHQRDGLVHS
ncbi:Indole-3-acetaldehyde oxidase [Citrus sinensis]|uniref:Indole-3-acetaldehyde oxidase n=1 Tax=Citrus sinensis TaxID=2711 RepID=A0ACB8IQE8_CITSI|nr:Indole-3-acetaldehyde oxidase [Citrus sinensis]